MNDYDIYMQGAPCIERLVFRVPTCVCLYYIITLIVVLYVVWAIEKISHNGEAYCAIYMLILMYWVCIYVYIYNKCVFKSIWKALCTYVFLYGYIVHSYEIVNNNESVEFSNTNLIQISTSKYVTHILWNLDKGVLN